MPNLPSISDAEWEVMNVLWNSSAASTALEIVQQLSSTHAWSDRTIKSMLNRLIKKNALRFEAEGKRYLYRPAVRQDQCVRAASRSFLSRVFAGSPGPMLIHLVTHTQLSAVEIESLQKLLRDKKAGKKEKP